jgi:hypothetical protein
VAPNGPKDWYPEVFGTANDGLDAPLILQFQTPQETNPKGHWGPHCFFHANLFCSPLFGQLLYQGKKPIKTWIQRLATLGKTSADGSIRTAKARAQHLCAPGLTLATVVATLIH